MGKGLLPVAILWNIVGIFAFYYFGECNYTKLILFIYLLIIWEGGWHKAAMGVRGLREGGRECLVFTEMASKRSILTFYVSEL